MSSRARRRTVFIHLYKKRSLSRTDLLLRDTRTHARVTSRPRVRAPIRARVVVAHRPRVVHADVVVDARGTVAVRRHLTGTRKRER